MGHIPFPESWNDKNSLPQLATDSEYDDVQTILSSFIPAYLVDKLENEFVTRARLDAAEAEIERLTFVLNDLTRQSVSASAETGIIVCEEMQTAQQKMEHASQIQNAKVSNEDLQQQQRTSQIQNANAILIDS